MLYHLKQVLVSAIGFLAFWALAPTDAAALVAPITLNPGDSVSFLPNGGSTDPLYPPAHLFDGSVDFSFNSGPSGVLRERILKYYDINQYHPYSSGIYFDYEITLYSGDVSAFSVSGYSALETSVKQCGISNCGGSGADGVLATEASRTADGNWISFYFGSDLSGTAHSANLQIFSNTGSWQDPPALIVDANGETFSLSTVGPAAVPEPTTWVMLLMGFAGINFVRFLATRMRVHIDRKKETAHRVGLACV